MNRIYSEDRIVKQLYAAGGQLSISLDKNDCAWNPATGKISIAGPANVRYSNTKAGIRCVIDKGVSYGDV